MNTNEMIGSDFIYQIDSSYGLSQDGYIATGTESIVYKGLKISKYRKDNSISSNQDINHKIDLQLKGKDNADNMWGLDRSVNRSLGKQIDILIHDLEDGTVLRNFYMVD